MSLATVDRVINQRPGVRASTVRKVNEAIERLGYRPNAAASRLARGGFDRFCFVLPPDRMLPGIMEAAERASAWLTHHRVVLDVVRVNHGDPEDLARAVEGIGSNYSGACIVGLDHPRVAAAVDLTADRGCAVSTIINDVPGSRRVAYFGIDNVAAGRTAGLLMGRFNASRPGTIAVVTNSAVERPQAERLFGFAQVLRRDFADLRLLAPRETAGAHPATRKTVELIAMEAPDLVGIYSAAGEHEDVAAVVADMGLRGRVSVIGHGDSPSCRRLLQCGALDAVVGVDLLRAVSSAARFHLAVQTAEPLPEAGTGTGIEIYLRDNPP